MKQVKSEKTEEKGKVEAGDFAVKRLFSGFWGL